MNGAARIEAALRGGAVEKRPRLVPFLTAGFPSPARFAELLPQIAAVSDAVEVGVPFTDPMADGVTIQRASEVALKQGTTLAGILETLSTLALQTPILLMSYLNPLLAYGPRKLARDAVAAGVSGFIVPDLPYEERDLLGDAFDAEGLALVPLVTPLTAPARRAQVVSAARGFVYAVTRTGTTGAAARPTLPIDAYLDQLRDESPAPVMAGFGIRSAAQVAEIAGHADGVIVGSALINAIERGDDPIAFLRALRPSHREPLA